MSARVGLATAIAVAKAKKKQNPTSPGAANDGGTTPQTTGGFHPRKVLAELGEQKGPLTPKQQQEIARAETILETRPVIQGYKGLVKQLGQEKATEAKGYEKLGSRVSGEVGSAYHSIAEQEAASIAQQSALAAQFGAQAQTATDSATSAIAANQQAAVAGNDAELALRGAPGGSPAQEALAQSVAAQNSQATTDLTAQQQANLAQSNATPQYLAAMAGSTAMGGGAAIGSIGRATVNRIGESNQKFGQSIISAREKLAEAKGTKGATFLKNLAGEREAGEKNKLSWAALAREKEEAAAAAQAAGVKAKTEAEERAEGRTQQQIENAQAQRELELTEKKVGNETYKTHHPGSSGGETPQQERQKEVAEVKSLIGPVVSGLGKVPENLPANKVLNKYIEEVNAKTSADPTVVAAVVKRWFKKRQHKEKIKDTAERIREMGTP